MAARLVKRVVEELKRLEAAPPSGVHAWLVNDSDVTSLEANITGPEDTVYTHGSFRVSIALPNDYPMAPPKVQFITHIYHPNIDAQGRICLDLLNMPPKGSWSPCLNLSTLLISLRLLLSQPNPDDGLVVDISDEFKNRRSEFDARARQMTAQYASGAALHAAAAAATAAAAAVPTAVQPSLLSSASVAGPRRALPSAHDVAGPSATMQEVAANADGTAQALHGTVGAVTPASGAAQATGEAGRAGHVSERGAVASASSVAADAATSFVAAPASRDGGDGLLGVTQGAGAGRPCFPAEQQPPPVEGVAHGSPNVRSAFDAREDGTARPSGTGWDDANLPQATCSTTIHTEEAGRTAQDKHTPADSARIAPTTAPAAVHLAQPLLKPVPSKGELGPEAAASQQPVATLRQAVLQPVSPQPVQPFVLPRTKPAGSRLSLKRPAVAVASASAAHLPAAPVDVRDEQENKCSRDDVAM